jgi:hypothetical protein
MTRGKAKIGALDDAADREKRMTFAQNVNLHIVSAN